ncbi:DUF1697 domain-containing protein [Microbacterium paraoxydans]|uniref:DUF1697 domain-containing protein n=1 Tax=Microbacterium paraoxydans TaxID=199592 RepID=UPI001CFA6AEB|nr:DUF1697 domain-containing protein [Microbacterium paraoxydans]
MSRSVLLLRAVNVSGRNRVPMARLREVLAAETDLVDVSTYIASGNIICATPPDPDTARAAVRSAIDREFGVDTPVIHRTHAQLVSSESAQPFPEGDATFVHAMFLEGPPASGALASLEERLLPAERLALVADDPVDRLRRRRRAFHEADQSGAGPCARCGGDGPQPAHDPHAHRADRLITHG